VDLQPWMGQLGIGAAAVTLFLITGKSYINYIGKQLAEARDQQREELKRLTEIYDRILADTVKRADSWETAFTVSQVANREAVDQIRKLTQVTDTTVALLQAIRDQGHP
jgi:hypothetical protein